MDTHYLEKLDFNPFDLYHNRSEIIKISNDFFRLVADFRHSGAGSCFGEAIAPDRKNSGIYAFYLSQGGLGLPDRDYYLKDSFAKQREAYVAHVTKMFTLLGEPPANAAADAVVVLNLETELAK